MGNIPNLTEEGIQEAADRLAKELAIIASNNSMTVKELFEGLGRTCKRLNALARGREAEAMGVESPT